MDGLNQAADVFTRRFRVTKPGMKRAHWAEDEPQLKQKLVSFTSFSINNYLLTRIYRSQSCRMLKSFYPKRIFEPKRRQWKGPGTSGLSYSVPYCGL